MDTETAIRSRRTHKAFGPEPVARETLEELFTLATFAPNHYVTNPWRFRVVGPGVLAALKLVVGPEGAAKLDRAPTLVVVSSVVAEESVQNEEDRDAAAAAAYIVLLAAHARGLAGYWRTPAFLRGAEGQRAVGIEPGTEQVLGLLHLGRPRQEPPVPERAPVSSIVTFLD